MPLILGTNSIKDTGFNVANSLRFDRGSSDYLNRTPSSAGDTKKASFSCWFKISELAATRSGAYQIFHSVYDGLNRWVISIDNSDQLFVGHYNGSSWDLLLISSQKIRDMSAFYNLIVIIDTSQSTNSNRVKIYLNGSQVTAFGTETYPSLNFNGIWCKNSTTEIGRYAPTSSQYGSFYLAESVCLDGTVATTTDFGEFDSDSPNIWKPIDVSGLTFGTNGFYLDFENASSLGADVSGNSNNFTVNNLTSVDQSTDTCTNNFATFNSLNGNNYAGLTFSEGNLKVTTTAGQYAPAQSTIGFNKGKWYAEFKATDVDNWTQVGIVGQNATATNKSVGTFSDGYAYIGGSSAGGSYSTLNNNSYSSYGATYTDGDIISVAVDTDNNKIYFAKNGTYINSGDPTSGSTGTGAAFTISATPTSGFYYFAVGNWSGSQTPDWEANFGSPPYSISSGNSDANGYGNFEYSVPSGYYALNSKNLAVFG